MAALAAAAGPLSAVRHGPARLRRPAVRPHRDRVLGGADPAALRDRRRARARGAPPLEGGDCPAAGGRRAGSLRCGQVMELGAKAC